MNQLWNTLKTTLFLGALTGLFLLIGAAIGGTAGMVVALLLAVGMNMGAWWFSDKLALKMSGARAVTPAEAPELHRMVEALAARADIPKPTVHVIDTPMPNAFATGRSPSKGAVAVTTGIMQTLNREELAGVIAHELAHIKHRDTLISSIAASVAGAVGMIADLVMWSLVFGGMGGDEEEGGLAGLGGGLVAVILAPIAALLIQLAISPRANTAPTLRAPALWATPSRWPGPWRSWKPACAPIRQSCGRRRRTSTSSARCWAG